MAVADPQIQNHFALLEGHDYMNLTTYRKNGTDVTRPVWFAQEGDSLYVVTVAESGKIKHIRNDERVHVSPSDVRGNPLSEERADGVARVIEKDDPMAKIADATLNKKYGIQKRLFSILFWIRRDNVVYIEIKPTSL